MSSTGYIVSRVKGIHSLLRHTHTHTHAADPKQAQTSDSAALILHTCTDDNRSGGKREFTAAGAQVLWTALLFLVFCAEAVAVIRWKKLRTQCSSKCSLAQQANSVSLWPETVARSLPSMDVQWQIQSGKEGVFRKHDGRRSAVSMATKSSYTVERDCQSQLQNGWLASRYLCRRKYFRISRQLCDWGVIKAYDCAHFMRTLFVLQISWNHKEARNSPTWKSETFFFLHLVTLNFTLKWITPDFEWKRKSSIGFRHSKPIFFYKS